MTEIHVGALALPKPRPWPGGSNGMPSDVVASLSSISPKRNTKGGKGGKTSGSRALRKDREPPPPIILSLTVPGSCISLPLKKRKTVSTNSANAAARPVKKRVVPAPHIHNTDNLAMLAALAVEDRDDESLLEKGTDAAAVKGGGMKAAKDKASVPTKPKDFSKRKPCANKRRTPPAAAPPTRPSAAASVPASSAPTQEQSRGVPQAQEASLATPQQPQGFHMPPHVAPTSQGPLQRAADASIQNQPPKTSTAPPLGMSPAVAWLPPASEPLIMLPLGHTLPAAAYMGHHQAPWLQQIHLPSHSSGPRVIQHPPAAVAPIKEASNEGAVKAERQRQQPAVSSAPISLPHAKATGAIPAPGAPEATAAAASAPMQARQQQPGAVQFLQQPLKWSHPHPHPHLPAASQPQELLFPVPWAPRATNLTMIRPPPPGGALVLPHALQQQQHLLQLQPAPPRCSPPSSHHQRQHQMMLSQQPCDLASASAQAKHGARAYRTQVRAQRRLKQQQGSSSCSSSSTASTSRAQKQQQGSGPSGQQPPNAPGASTEATAPSAADPEQPSRMSIDSKAGAASSAPRPQQQQQQQPAPLHWHHPHHQPGVLPPQEVLFPWANVTFIRPPPHGAALALPSALHQQLQQPAPPRCSLPMAVPGQQMMLPQQPCEAALAQAQAKHGARAYRTQVRAQRRLKQQQGPSSGQQPLSAPQAKAAEAIPAAAAR